MTRPHRPDWHAYGLQMAQTVATRSDCERAQHGAVIMNLDHRIVGVGYNGSPAGHPGCETCPRRTSDVASLTGYDNCVSLHAEQNAVIYAGREKCLGATIYITGQPCFWCWKTIMGAGIHRAVWADAGSWNGLAIRYAHEGVFQ